MTVAGPADADALGDADVDEPTPFEGDGDAVAVADDEVVVDVCGAGVVEMSAPAGTASTNQRK